jgi:hypothetical protein
MATKTMTEAHHRQQLADVKHRANLAKREGQIERYQHRLEILAHRAAQLSDQELAGLRAKWDTLRREVAAMRTTVGVTERKHRAAAAAAFKDLRDSFRATQEKHGLVKPKKA